MQKATISARSARRSGGCFAFDNRAKPDAKSHHLGGAFEKRAKLDAKSDDFGGRERRGKGAGVAHPPGQVEALGRVGDWGCAPSGPGGSTKVNRNGERKRSSVITEYFS